MKLLIGLGNPGEQYVGTRHNLGFDVLDEYRRKINAPEWSLNKKLKSEISQVSSDLILVRPQTFMNNSGQASSLVKSYFKIDTEDIIVVHDELDLPLKQIKIRKGGAAAGHHGVESIMEALGTDQFMRIRLGIGNLKTQSAEHNAAHIDTSKYVLEPFMEGEKSDSKQLFKHALKAIEILLEEGLEKAQNQFN